MKLSEALKKAVKEHDLSELSKITDFMRFRLGWNYAKQAEQVKKHVGLDIPEWDELLQEVDYHVSQMN